MPETIKELSARKLDIITELVDREFRSTYNKLPIWMPKEERDKIELEMNALANKLWEARRLKEYAVLQIKTKEWE